jgi:6,7-dimethyl-8-ribityllumazine synthase
MVKAKEEEERKLGFLVSEFHRDITYQMEIPGREHAAFLGVNVYRTVYTPGTLGVAGLWMARLEAQSSLRINGE